MTRRRTLSDLAWTASQSYRGKRREYMPESAARDAACGYFDGYLAGRRAERRARAKAIRENAGR